MLTFKLFLEQKILFQQGNTPKNKLKNFEYESVYKLRSQKLPMAEIMKKTGYDRITLRKYADSDEAKKRPDYVPHHTHKLADPNYVKKSISDEHMIKMYKMRKEGNSDTAILKNMHKDIGFHQSNYKYVREKHLDRPDNVEKFTKLGHYHPRVG